MTSSILRTHADEQGTLKVYVNNIVKILYEECINPSASCLSVVQEVQKLIQNNTLLPTALAHNAPFLAVCVILMMIGEESIKVSVAHQILDLANTHYNCKVLVGQVGGFHAVVEMIIYGSIDAKEAGFALFAALVEAEENCSKLLMTGIPEALIDVLVEEGEKILSAVKKIFWLTGSFELCFERLFIASQERLIRSELYNVTMQSLNLVKHIEGLNFEYMEGNIRGVSLNS